MLFYILYLFSVNALPTPLLKNVKVSELVDQPYLFLANPTTSYTLPDFKSLLTTTIKKGDIKQRQEIRFKENYFPGFEVNYFPGFKGNYFPGCFQVSTSVNTLCITDSDTVGLYTVQCTDTV